MLTRRSLLLWAGAVGGSVMAGARIAEASLSKGLSLSELVHSSRFALLATPVAAASRWEKVGRSSRIVTYSTVRVEGPLDGRNPPGTQFQVRTLGGIVDDIGQVVAGEAPLQRGAASALFLQDLGNQAFVVTGMAQGYYPVTADGRGVKRLRAATAARDVIADAQSAVRRLDGVTLLELQDLIARELGRGAK